MNKLYYNGVLLPEMPWEDVVAYPYAWIRKNLSSGYYDLILSSQKFYYKSSADGIYYANTYNEKWYRISIDNVESATSWILNKSRTDQSTSSWYSLDAQRVILWSNIDIPLNSASATTIHFSKSNLIRTSEYPMMYYNGMLLPKFTEYFLKAYPYVFIYEQANRYCIIYSKKPYIMQISDRTIQPGNNNEVVNLLLYKDALSEGSTWSFRNTTTYYYNETNRIQLWSNYDILENSIVYFSKRTPLNVGAQDIQAKYIRTGGAQYLNTGIIPDASTEVELKYSVDKLLDLGPHILSTASWYFPFPRSRNGGNFLANRCGNELVISIKPKVNNVYTIKMDSVGQILIDDVLCGTLEAGTTEITTPLYLGTYGNNPGSTSHTGNIRVYYCKIWQNGELVRNFVPMYMSDGRMCMSESVENKLYYGDSGYDFLECYELLPDTSIYEQLYSIKLNTLIDIGNVIRNKHKTRETFTSADMAKYLQQL